VKNQAFPTPALSRRWVLRVVFALFLIASGYVVYARMGCLIAAGLARGPGLTDLNGSPVGNDFVEFYAASALCRQGAPAAVYHQERLHAMERQVIGAPIVYWPWHYPPTFLLLLLPLAYLPYLAALGLWLGTSLMGYLALLKRAAPHRLTPWLALAFPPVVNNFFYGQNGYFSGLLLGGGLVWLSSRPWLAGVLLGLLSFKPHLAALIPIALSAGRQWRALGGFALSAAGLALMSLLMLGFEPWAAFFANLGRASQTLANTDLCYKMVTIQAMALSLGASARTAGLLQGAAALAALALVILVWRLPGAPLPHRGAILALAVIFATPYAMEYDLAILGLPLALMGEQAVRNPRPGGEIFLMAVWAGIYFVSFAPANLGFQATPLVLMGLTAFTLVRFLRPPPTCQSDSPTR
jgi:hypothetical protein